MNHAQLRETLRTEDAASVYGRLSGRPDWGEALERMIPGHMHHWVTWWILAGAMDDAFLEAVVTNDLKETFRAADDINRLKIKDYVMFFYNYAPGPCWGSLAQAQSWAAQGGLLEIVTEPVD